MSRPRCGMTELKEALDSARPLQLEGLVECLLRQYRGSARGGAAEGLTTSGRLLCPGCGGFLRDPVTAQCGHTYCWPCLRGEPRRRCRVCQGDMGCPPRRTCVLLRQLADRCVPRSRGWQHRDIAELLGAGHHREALHTIRLAMDTDPNDLILRVYRAESYAALFEFGKAHKELDFVLSKQHNWPEVYFRKAKILQDTGNLYESLTTYLQCLAVDEEFASAITEIEKILRDFLSPVPETVDGILRALEMTPLPNLPMKPFVLGSDNKETSYRLQTYLGQDKVLPKPLKSLSGRGLQRTQSVHALHCNDGTERGDGLKRVSSEPLLSSQEAGVLLKRKLSLSEQDANICEDGRKKHIMQEGSDEDLSILLADPSVLQSLIDGSDFECSLCMRLFYEPVTTPCGHTFCKKCLERCLDHTPQCPLCKQSLTEYLAHRIYNVTYLLEELINQYLPEELSERKRLHAEETFELSNLTKNVPIFVCTMAYPTVPCPLHVFEPRYRLMIRRCMETGTKQFGMCISDPENSFADYGCMLEIRNVHFLPDGRSVVDTIGGKRFLVLKRGMRDGYCTADIEYLTDTQVEEEELQQLRGLHDTVYAQACRWFQNLRYKFRSQILYHFGSMPEREDNIQVAPSGPAWCWWLLAVLPVDPRYQLSVLSMRSLKERLLKIQHILTCFSRDQSK